MPWTKLQIEKQEPVFDEHAGDQVRKLSYGEALREALDQALERGMNPMGRSAEPLSLLVSCCGGCCFRGRRLTVK